MLKTQAAYIEQLGEPLVIANDVEVPDLQPGQVLVKLAYSGICHSQLMEARGNRGEDKFLPHLLGHEGSGVVQSVGPQVKKVKVGDKVILGWIKAEGMNVGGAKYKRGNTVINAGGVTTFQKHAVISENRIVPLPAGVPLDIAVLFGCALPTGAGMVLNTLKPTPGSSIAIWGLGGIGMSALLATRMFECKTIIAIDREDEKLALAKEFGATHTIKSGSDPTQTVKEILTITEGKGLDYCVEAAGLANTIEAAFRSVRTGGGQCVFASHPKHGETIKLDPYDLICGKNIKGSWGGDARPDADIPKLAEGFRKGVLPLTKLLTKSYKLEQINQALEDLESRKIVRAFLELDSSL